MARTGVTKEQVFEAATALVQAGTTPTVQAIRTRLGTGSYTTINAHLADWREANADQQVPQIPEPPEVVGQALATVWAQAWRAAQDSIAAEREALEGSRRAMALEQEEMSAEIKRLESNAENLLGELEESRKGLADAQGEIQELRLDTAKMTERNRALEEQVKDIRKREQTASSAMERLQAQLIELSAAQASAPSKKPPKPKHRGS